MDMEPVNSAYGYMPREVLGLGAFAIVYRGRRNADNSFVAVKVIKKPFEDEEKRMKEIHILKELSHENIVRLYEFVDNSVNPVLVLEYCNGGDLAKYLQAKGVLSEPTIQLFGVQITSALSYLHSLGVVHRDLKPPNVLLCHDSHGIIPAAKDIKIKISDFGFARVVEDHAMAATYCGSPLYMAPEVYFSKRYDFKADIWSFGVVLYQCLVGKCPFTAKNPEQMRRMYECSQNLRLEFPPYTSECFQNLIRSMLTFNPSKRMDHVAMKKHPFFQLDPGKDSAGAVDKSDPTWKCSGWNDPTPMMPQPGSSRNRSCSSGDAISLRYPSSSPIPITDRHRKASRERSFQDDETLPGSPSSLPGTLRNTYTTPITGMPSDKVVKFDVGSASPSTSNVPSNSPGPSTGRRGSGSQSPSTPPVIKGGGRVVRILPQPTSGPSPPGFLCMTPPKSAFLSGACGNLPRMGASPSTAPSLARAQSLPSDLTFKPHGLPLSAGARVSGGGTTTRKSYDLMSMDFMEEDVPAEHVAGFVPSYPVQRQQQPLSNHMSSPELAGLHQGMPTSRGLSFRPLSHHQGLEVVCSQSYLGHRVDFRLIVSDKSVFPLDMLAPSVYRSQPNGSYMEGYHLLCWHVLAEVTVLDLIRLLCSQSKISVCQTAQDKGDLILRALKVVRSCVDLLTVGLKMLSVPGLEKVMLKASRAVLAHYSFLCAAYNELTTSGTNDVDTGSQAHANMLLFKYSCSLCQLAIADEFLNVSKTTKSRYAVIYLLYSHLLKEVTSVKDKAILKEYCDQTGRRLLSLKF